MRDTKNCLLVYDLVSNLYRICSGKNVIVCVVRTSSLVKCGAISERFSSPVRGGCLVCELLISW